MQFFALIGGTKVIRLYVCFKKLHYVDGIFEKGDGNDANCSRRMWWMDRAKSL
jgi:hypothetical protein